MLVAAAYRCAGGKVAFRREQPGKAQTYDMDVAIGGRNFAVECKRMDTGEYGDRERTRMRELLFGDRLQPDSLSLDAAHFATSISSFRSTKSR
jgi:hypothetical protein